MGHPAFVAGGVEPQVPPLRFAPVGMTKFKLVPTSAVIRRMWRFGSVDLQSLLRYRLRIRPGDGRCRANGRRRPREYAGLNGGRLLVAPLTCRPPRPRRLCAGKP